MIITNRMNLPEGLVKAAATRRRNDPGRISATTLLKGTKEIILTDRHWDQIEDDVSDRVWAIFGAAVHALLEHEGENDFTEQFMSAEMDGVKVTGRIDNYNMKTGVVADYKTATVWKIKFHDFDDWRKQGMIYAWLLAKNGFAVKRCQFIAFLKDHSKNEAKRDSGYPPGPIHLYEFDVTPERLVEIESFIAERIAKYRQCLPLKDDAIPPCSPGERWDKPAKYAVKKEGRKTAVRVLDSEDEASKMSADLGKGHFVEIRRGESVKCQSYCSCCAFCDYYRTSVMAEEQEAEASA